MKPLLVNEFYCGNGNVLEYQWWMGLSGAGDHKLNIVLESGVWICAG